MKVFSAFVFVLCVVPAANAAVTLAAVRDYASSSNANSVDSSGTVLAVAAFTNNVAAAFDAGTGGVVNFDGLGEGRHDGTWNVSYGSGQTFVVSTSSVNMRVEMNATATIRATPISGDAYYRLTGVSANILTFDTNPLSEFGFTILARNSARGLDHITVTFTDGSTEQVVGSTSLAANTATGMADYIDSPNSGPDVFFGYQAPEGKAILSVAIDASDLNDGNLVIDDFGFIVSPIPEPSAALLGIGGFVAMAARRRRI